MKNYMILTLCLQAVAQATAMNPFEESPQKYKESVRPQNPTATKRMEIERLQQQGVEREEEKASELLQDPYALEVRKRKEECIKERTCELKE